MRTLVRDLPGCLGDDVRLRGWVQAIRDQKAVQFIVLRDESGQAQLVIERSDSNHELNARVSALTVESAITIEGNVVSNERVRLGGLEVVVRSIEVDNLAEAVLPVTPESALEKRLDWRYLDLRQPRNNLIFEVQTAVEAAMRNYWIANAFTEIHSPKLMGSASESGAELFRVEYFERYAYLAQSPQFYKQMAMAAGFGSVFEIGPVFRANPSFTSRHDTEFTSVDVEISWIDSHEDVMAFEEAWLAAVFAEVGQRFEDAISGTFGVELTVPSTPFPRISLADAKKWLAQAGNALLGEDDDLDPASERALSELVRERDGHEFVFVTDYPSSVRPFYHMRHPENQALTKSFDLLWRGIEITTGAQREHRFEQLMAQAREKRVELEPLNYYFDFFRFGCPPHGGFGFGLTRLLMRMLDQPNVREVTFLYRGPNRLTP